MAIIALLAGSILSLTSAGLGLLFWDISLTQAASIYFVGGLAIGVFIIIANSTRPIPAVVVRPTQA